MRRIVTGTGTTIELDGDLLVLIEALYQEIIARHAVEQSLEDMVAEIDNLIAQMDEVERRRYLAESLFLNSVQYENQKAEAYLRSLLNPR